LLFTFCCFAGGLQAVAELLIFSHPPRWPISATD